MRRWDRRVEPRAGRGLVTRLPHPHTPAADSGVDAGASSADRATGPSPMAKRGRGPGARLEVVIIAVVLAIAALFTAGLLGYGLAGRSSHPGEGSPEAGFARDMQAHHGQAVQMALTIRDKTSDPTLRTVAYDIITSQQQQSGQMFAWLRLWGLPQTGSAPAMEWMSSGGHSMSGMSASSSSAASGTVPTRTGTATMPGMASAEDLKRLNAATGVDAERLFLQLMIAHHRGGVQMAQAVLERTNRPEVVALAQAIKSAQAAEIEQMETLLQARASR